MVNVVTLTVTFDLLQGQICCRAGDYNSLNLLVGFDLQHSWLILFVLSSVSSADKNFNLTFTTHYLIVAIEIWLLSLNYVFFCQLLFYQALLVWVSLPVCFFLKAYLQGRGMRNIAFFLLFDVN